VREGVGRGGEVGGARQREERVWSSKGVKGKARRVWRGVGLGLANRGVEERRRISFKILLKDEVADEGVKDDEEGKKEK